MRKATNRLRDEDDSGLRSMTKILRVVIGIFLAVHHLRFCTCNAGGAGSIPGWETKVPQAAQHGQK